MSKFFVHNTIFNLSINYENNLNVKSYNKNYNVSFCSDTLETILNDKYKEGDIIIADIFFNYVLNENKNVIFIEALEKNKTIENVLELFDILYYRNFNKSNKLIIIGGGIIQDICGFLSAIYKRGVNWLFIPTTMLAMTDSCIGGKVCLNRHSKNMIALFNSPSKIIISNWFLKTLDNDMIMSGLGESLKLALIAGKEHYDFFVECFHSKKYVNIIKQSLSIKKIIIEKDELEKDERRVLNYGHTIGHAIEIVSNYYIPHGIAVLFGIYYVNRLFGINNFDSVNELILNMIPQKYKIQINKNDVLKQVMNDKKNKGTLICFIVVENFGLSSFRFIEINDIDYKLKEIMI